MEVAPLVEPLVAPLVEVEVALQETGILCSCHATLSRCGCRLEVEGASEGVREKAHVKIRNL